MKLIVQLCITCLVGLGYLSAGTAELVEPSLSEQNGIVSSCSEAFAEYHKCMQGFDNRTHKNEEGNRTLSDQIKRCFTENGCTAPQEEGPESNQTKQCRDSIYNTKREKVRACVSEKYPKYVFPERQERHHDKHLANVENALQNCAKKEEVEKCKRSAAKRHRKLRFLIGCGHRGFCMAKLDRSCQKQLKWVKKKSCECRKGVLKEVAAIRASLSECKGVPHKPHQHHNDTCYYGGYCSEGFKAYRRDHSPHHSPSSPQSLLGDIISKPSAGASKVPAAPAASKAQAAAVQPPASPKSAAGK